MFAFGTTAYKLYSATRGVGSTLSTLSNWSKWMSEAILLQPSEMQNLHPKVRTRLEWLLRRILVISQPLNFCLVWSQHKGSAVAETVHQSKEVLKQVYTFLADCGKDKSKLMDTEYMLVKLEEYINEIEFCLQSLNLALTIISTTNPLYPNSNNFNSTLNTNIGQNVNNNNNNNNNNIGLNAISSSSSTAKHPSMISPSCLLKASNRITIMHRSGGDVALCFGQLFYKTFIDVNDEEIFTPQWKRIYQRATFKLVRNPKRHIYEVRIECNDVNRNDTGTGMMDEYFEADHDPNNIHTSAHYLLRKPSALKFELNSSLAFSTVSSALLLPHKRQMLVDYVQSGNSSMMEDAFAWTEMVVNQVKAQYCFVFKSGLENWDDPIDEDSYCQYEQGLMNGNGHNNNFSQPTTSNGIVHTDEAMEPNVSSLIPPSVSQSPSSVGTLPNIASSTSQNKEPYLSASILSLDDQVQSTKKHSHLSNILTPGGDYDESHTTPQLMAYLIRLAIYENEYSRPNIVTTKVKEKEGILKKKVEEDTLDYTTTTNEDEDEDEDEDEENMDENNICFVNETTEFDPSWHKTVNGENNRRTRSPPLIYNHKHTNIDTSLHHNNTSGFDKNKTYGKTAHPNLQQQRYSVSAPPNIQERTARIKALNNDLEHKPLESNNSLLHQEFQRDFQKVINTGFSAGLPAHLNASDEELYLILQNPPAPQVLFYHTDLSTKTRVNSSSSLRSDTAGVGSVDSGFGNSDCDTNSTTGTETIRKSPINVPIASSHKRKKKREHNHNLTANQILEATNTPLLRPTHNEATPVIQYQTNENVIQKSLRETFSLDESVFRD